MLLKEKDILIIIILALNFVNISGQTNNSIDATSSATRKYKITGGTVDDNSATIRWSSRYDNGTLEIKWGTSQSNLTNSKSMYPYKRGTTAQITLDNLIPGTKYYYRVNGTWNLRTYNNLMGGSFTTTESNNTAIYSFITHYSMDQTIAVSKDKLRTNLLFIPGDAVNILDSRGVLVKMIFISTFCRETDISCLGNGHYIFNLMRNNKTIHQTHGSKF
jgi:hypothetical protein